MHQHLSGIFGQIHTQDKILLIGAYIVDQKPEWKLIGLNDFNCD
jgi:hypothetical protein